MMTSLTPWVKRILLTWVVLWVLSFLFLLTDIDLPQKFGLWPESLGRGEFTSVLGLFGYAFFHDPGGIFHLLFNCMVFYWTGPEIERYFPGRRFLKFVGVVVVVGAATRLLLAAIAGYSFSGPAFGGSGIVAACMFGLAALQPGLRVNLIFITVPILPLVLVLGGLDVLNLIATFAGKGSPIASELHLAGAAVGWAWGGGFLRFPIFARWSAKRQQAKFNREQAKHQARELELDRILAKITREGIGKLTPAEKEFLDNRSNRPD
jgi:membrane associated rhomboid family serine protease